MKASAMTAATIRVWAVRWTSLLSVAASGSSEAAGGAVGEANRTFVVDDHDHVGEPIEDRRQLVAVGRHHAEALFQRGAHRVEGAGQVADLVRAGDGERRVEGAAGHLAGGAGEADHPVVSALEGAGTMGT